MFKSTPPPPPLVAKMSPLVFPPTPPPPSQQKVREQLEMKAVDDVMQVFALVACVHGIVVGVRSPRP